MDFPVDLWKKEIGKIDLVSGIFYNTKKTILKWFGVSVFLLLSFIGQVGLWSGHYSSNIV